MLTYKLSWRVRYIFTSLAAVLLVLSIWLFSDIEHNGPFKALLLILVVNAISWSVSLWRDPSGFKLSDIGVEVYYPLKGCTTIPWLDIRRVNHLSSKKSKNGFGQEELEIEFGESSVYVVKCLKEYTEFESAISAKLNS